VYGIADFPEVEDLIMMEGYVMDHVNLKLVWKLDPLVIHHDLSYPHLMLIVDSRCI
jgi:hypothetical protein